MTHLPCAQIPTLCARINCRQLFHRCEMTRATFENVRDWTVLCLYHVERSAMLLFAIRLRNRNEYLRLRYLDTFFIHFPLNIEQGSNCYCVGYWCRKQRILNCQLKNCCVKISYKSFLIAKNSRDCSCWSILQWETGLEPIHFFFFQLWNAVSPIWVYADVVPLVNYYAQFCVVFLGRYVVCTNVNTNYEVPITQKKYVVVFWLQCFLVSIFTMKVICEDNCSLL